MPFTYPAVRNLLPSTSFVENVTALVLDVYLARQSGIKNALALYCANLECAIRISKDRIEDSRNECSVSA